MQIINVFLFCESIKKNRLSIQGYFIHIEERVEREFSIHIFFLKALGSIAELLLKLDRIESFLRIQYPQESH